MISKPILISPQTHRRFLMGKQGLYPGRRWRGKSGAAEAIRAIEAVQIDPLNITARNHDLVLHSRVVDYDISHLDTLAHQDRLAFDYGNLLFYYPIQDLPYFRPVMRWWTEHSQLGAFAHANPDLIDLVRSQLRENGAQGNRHFQGTARVESYRARKDTGLALRYLWATGELITHSRTRFERNFAFSADVLPAEVMWEATDEQTLDYFLRKSLKFLGIGTKTLWKRGTHYLYQRYHPTFDAAVNALIESGEVLPVKVDGKKDIRYVFARDLADLEALERGEIPASWSPLGTTTDQEVIFVPPLDIVSGRQRALDVFGFDYIWEVYKPAEQRRWGYYCLPILYGDRLVGRFDPKMERKENVLRINGFWLEDNFTPDDAFADALGRGLANFMSFNGAASVDMEAIQPTKLRKRAAKHLKA